MSVNLSVSFILCLAALMINYFCLLIIVLITKINLQCLLKLLQTFSLLISTSTGPRKALSCPSKTFSPWNSGAELYLTCKSCWNTQATRYFWMIKRRKEKNNQASKIIISDKLSDTLASSIPVATFKTSSNSWRLTLRETHGSVVNAGKNRN